jgi:hypothetical protein
MVADWSGPGGGEADADPACPQLGEPVAHLAVVQHAALDRRRVDLIQREMIAQQIERLSQLPAERRGRKVLDLRGIGLNLPIGGVPVAPFRGDGGRARGQPPAFEPRGEEGLRPAV